MNKQETLEETIERLFRYYPESTGYRKAAIIGKEWQQERSYSEDEVMDMFHNLSMHLPLHYEFLVNEQFKKK